MLFSHNRQTVDMTSNPMYSMAGKKRGRGIDRGSCSAAQASVVQPNGVLQSTSVTEGAIYVAPTLYLEGATGGGVRSTPHAQQHPAQKLLIKEETVEVQRHPNPMYESAGPKQSGSLQTSITSAPVSSSSSPPSAPPSSSRTASKPSGIVPTNNFYDAGGGVSSARRFPAALSRSNVAVGAGARGGVGARASAHAGAGVGVGVGAAGIGGRKTPALYSSAAGSLRGNNMYDAGVPSYVVNFHPLPRWYLLNSRGSLTWRHAGPSQQWSSRRR